MLKKVVAVVLTAAMAMSVGMPAFAAEDESILDDLANNIVQIEVVSDDSGAIVTTYTGLDTFVEKIHNEYPEITDYDIAEFMNKYTNQYFEGMPEEELLRILNYDNISTSKQFVIINADGTSNVSNEEALPADTWTSADGCMEITTSYTGYDSDETGVYYDVWSTANWLKYPTVRYQDAFTLGGTGEFDSNFAVSGYVLQFGYCNMCNHTTYRDRFVNDDRQYDSGLELTYPGFPTLTFNPYYHVCEQCSRIIGDSNFRAQIRYGVKAEGMRNLQAAYGHGTANITGIDVSFDSKGKPTFAGIGATVETYYARPVTINR